MLGRPLFENRGYCALGRKTIAAGGAGIQGFPMRKFLLDSPPSRWAIIGNTGSGKTTLARKIAELSGAALLDLDTVAWSEDAQAPERRTLVETRHQLQRFCAEHSTHRLRLVSNDPEPLTLPLVRRVSVLSAFRRWLTFRHDHLIIPGSSGSTRTNNSLKASPHSLTTVRDRSF